MEETMRRKKYDAQSEIDYLQLLADKLEARNREMLMKYVSREAVHELSFPAYYSILTNGIPLQGKGKIILLNDIERIPTVDLRVGDWRFLEDDGGYPRCPFCDEMNETDDPITKFCPNCGADLRGEDRNVLGKGGENG
jgi:hypothetical protein